MATRVGIMGFGRIGRNIFRQAYEREDIDIVAISDLGSPESMAYLLGYDTIYGRFPGEVRLDGKYLIAGRQRARLLRSVSPAAVPWDVFGVDVVIEATGSYRKREQLQGHLDSGARRVVLSTPALDSIDRTIVHGLNEGNLRASDRIVSCASTTTNALCPILKVLHEAIGVKRAFATVVHAYTSDQRLSDSMAGELRRSRSAAENLIPNTTWLADLVDQLIPPLAGKVEAIAINAPVPNGSNIDLVTQLEGGATAEDVNEAVRAAAAGELGRILQVADEPIVSSDVVGNAHSAVFDSLATLSLPGGLVKSLTWFDNGWGYAGRILDTVLLMGALPEEEVAA